MTTFGAYPTGSDGFLSRVTDSLPFVAVIAPLFTFFVSDVVYLVNEVMFIRARNGKCRWISSLRNRG